MKMSKNGKTIKDCDFDTKEKYWKIAKSYKKSE